MARKTIIITEGQLSRIISESRGQYNIKSVYHVSSDDFNSFKTDIHFPYIFFSNKPITLNNSKYLYTCNLSVHKPFIFEHAFSWSYPLWLYLTDKNGNLIERDDFTMDRYEGYLGCPFEFWQRVYEDDYEWE